MSTMAPRMAPVPISNRRMALRRSAEMDHAAFRTIDGNHCSRVWTRAHCWRCSCPSDDAIGKHGSKTGADGSRQRNESPTSSWLEESSDGGESSASNGLSLKLGRRMVGGSRAMGFERGCASVSQAIERKHDRKQGESSDALALSRIGAFARGMDAWLMKIGANDTKGVRTVIRMVAKYLLQGSVP